MGWHWLMLWRKPRPYKVEYVVLDGQTLLRETGAGSDGSPLMYGAEDWRRRVAEWRERRVRVLDESKGD